MSKKERRGGKDERAAKSREEHSGNEVFRTGTNTQTQGKRQQGTYGDGGLDERVELLVSADGELQMAGGDALHLEVLGGVSGKLEHLGAEVLKDGGAVDGSGGSDAVVGLDALLQVAVDTSDRELRAEQAHEVSLNSEFWGDLFCKNKKQLGTLRAALAGTCIQRAVEWAAGGRHRGRAGKKI